MAIKISNNTIIDDSRNVINATSVGVGTTNPTTQLDVIGNSYISSSIGIGTTNPTTQLDVIGNSYISSSIGIGTTNPTTQLDVIGNSYISSSIGIGTTNPTTQLDVIGNSYISSSIGIGNTASGISGDLKVSSINNGFLAGFRNAVINGNFDVWQRLPAISPATSWTTTSNIYTADRWAIIPGGSQSVTVGQVSSSLAGRTGQYALRVTSNSSSTSNLWLETYIEDVRTFNNQVVTVSFKARASTTVSLEGRLTQDFGSGGSSAVELAMATKSVTTSWQTFTHTYTNGSVDSKTIGDGSYLGIKFLFSNNALGSGQWMEFAEVQLEPGPVATPFERRPYVTEVALCQRYYIPLHDTFSARFFPTGHGYMTSLSSGRFLIPLPVTMRAAPTVTIGSAEAQVRCGGETEDVSSVNTVAVNDNGVIMNVETTTFTITPTNQAAHISMGQNSSLSAEL